MIWSIIPEDLLFAKDEGQNDSLRRVDYLGRHLLVRPSAGGQAEIVSVLSTDPVDFLDGRLYPGTRIRI